MCHESVLYNINYSVLGKNYFLSFNRKLIDKSPNIWQLNNILLKIPWVKQEVSKEIEKMHSTEWKWKYYTSNLVGYT